jgi:capsular polysaccharide biosynthesis protein
MDLIIFLKVLLKRKWLILFIILFAVTAERFITRITPEKYVSKAQIATVLYDTMDSEGKISLMILPDYIIKCNV